ncbi:MAG: NTP transferase domain-containing protein [Desulfurococcales archaeon]|nr:NTP transferase domain-containing protein [Desulfurococcales archaeon]
MKDAAGIILVGGSSERYGRPKALEKIEGKTFLERVFKELSELTSSILISYSERTPREAVELAVQLGGNLVKDQELPCSGPPRGLSSIMSLDPIYTSYWIVAVDYPYIKADTLSRLAEIADKTGVEALSPLLPGGYPAVTVGYVKGNALQAIRDSCITRRHLTRTTDLYRGAGISMYPEWSYFTDSYKEFLNVNDPGMHNIRVSPPIQEQLILGQGNFFSKALSYIKGKKYLTARVMYIVESEQYKSLGLTLFSIHARKDAHRVAELEKLVLMANENQMENRI